MTAAIQRAGVLSQLPALLAEHGVPPAAAFAGSGIEERTFTADARIPFTAALRLLERAVELTGCPHLGLLLGQRFSLAHHGPLGQVMRAAPTLGQALRDFTAWQPGYSSGAVVYLQPMGEEHAFGYGAAGAGSRALYDLVMAVGVRMLEELTGGTVQAEELFVSFRPPPDKAAYARHLRPPVRFNQRQVCLVLASKNLDAPLPGANPALRRSLLSAFKATGEGSRPAASLRTRHALRRTLQQGSASMEAVAAELAMHPRTLRRRLAAEQTSFEALSEAIRFEMAREFLELTDLPMSDISAALAYASPGVFSDAFNRWTGLSPLAWRRRMSLPHDSAASA